MNLGIALSNNLGLNILIGIISLIFIIISAEYSVKKVIGLLNHYGYSKTFGGLVVFSLVTSLPEIFTNLTASFGIMYNLLDYNVASATVMGASIGSDVIQQTLIIGIVALFVTKMSFDWNFIYRAYVPMILTTFLVFILSLNKVLSRVDGLILVLCFIGYIFYLYGGENPYEHRHYDDNIDPKKDIFLILCSFLLMLLGAHLLLSSAEKIVNITNLGGSLIGVMVIGIVSAAPELFTALSGLKNDAKGISLGTLIGSNLTNPLLAIGLGSIVSTYWVPDALLQWDLPMEALTAMILLGYICFNDNELDKNGGLLLIGLYIFYVVIRIWYFPTD